MPYLVRQTCVETILRPSYSSHLPAMMSGLNHLLKLNSYSIRMNHEEKTLHILMKWDGGIQWAFKK